MDHFLLGPLVGGLAHDHANLWGRARGAGVLHAWLGEQHDLSDAHLAGKSLPLTAENGYAGVAAVSGLLPDRRYYYALTLSGDPPPAKAHPSFTTFPNPGERVPFSFAFGSCFQPKNAAGGKIFDAIETARQAENLRFILLTGDQIYADARQHNGIGKIACTLEEYRAVYAYTWSRPTWQRLMVNLPVFMTLDDHEVDDDWRWVNRSRQEATIPWWDRLKRWLQGLPAEERRIPLKRVQDALQAYWEHQGMHAPGFELPPQLAASGQYALSASDPGSVAYTFAFGGAAFFVLDTRTMRVVNRRERVMLGEGQWQALEAWLLAVKDAYPVKFIVTSCALLFSMWLDVPQDRWSGFPQERSRLLHFLAANDIQDVVLLAGDLHSSHAVYAELYGAQGRPLPLWEFCSTPFEQSPNKLARRTYLPLRGGAVKTTRLEFVQAQNNFGIVRV
ncbi:MAG: alkaline phosphatase family protein, partial [Chloroflexi bacterium]|nr:alkaline phosphatase family protein [Chloroflexota bacterium]